MWSSDLSKDLIIFLLLLNYLIMIVVRRYEKYRNYRFYPTNMNFAKYLKNNFLSLPTLFYAVLLLFVELVVAEALDYT